MRAGAECSSLPLLHFTRRILCNLLGNDVEAGLLPDDNALLDPLVQNICHKNAAGFFGF